MNRNDMPLRVTYRSRNPEIFGAQDGAADINFVVNSWAGWRSVLASADYRLENVASRIISNEDVWVVLTYLQLRRRGLCASISNAPAAERINILDGISFAARPAPANLFYVGCRGDGHYPGLCQVVIRQNGLESPGQPSFYIPQWTQPAIIPRASARTGIRTLGFLGHAEINLARPFKDPAFAARLRSLGCELIVRGKSEDRVSWHDYSDLDLILAVRDIPPSHLQLKPVNKLTNAWAAGVPALLGPEPAIEAIRRSRLDYIPVITPADVFGALATLRETAGLYQRMVAHGRSRAAEFDDDAVANRWFAVLDQVRERFRDWRSLNPVQRQLNQLRRIVSYRLSLRRHVHEVHYAYRRLGYGAKWWEAV
jgi:hypothetical protein